MRCPFKTENLYLTYLLLSLLLVSARLIALPYLLDCDYDHQGYGLHTGYDHSVGYQFNRMSDPIGLNDLKLLPVLLIPGDGPKKGPKAATTISGWINEPMKDHA